MREIKFRVWCKEYEQFIQFNKMGFLEDGSLWYVQGVDEDEKETDPPYFENQNDWELMQYTGLKDKNGVEIYEGDMYHHGEPRITYTVVWVDSGLKGKQNSSTSYAGLESWCDQIEVIGNIYENPELLEREAE